MLEKCQQVFEVASNSSSSSLSLSADQEEMDHNQQGQEEQDQQQFRQHEDGCRKVLEPSSSEVQHVLLDKCQQVVEVASNSSSSSLSLSADKEEMDHNQQGQEEQDQQQFRQHEDGFVAFPNSPSTQPASPGQVSKSSSFTVFPDGSTKLVGASGFELYDLNNIEQYTDGKRAFDKHHMHVITRDPPTYLGTAVVVGTDDFRHSMIVLARREANGDVQLKRVRFSAPPIQFCSWEFVSEAEALRYGFGNTLTTEERETALSLVNKYTTAGGKWSKIMSTEPELPPTPYGVRYPTRASVRSQLDTTNTKDTPKHMNNDTANGTTVTTAKWDNNKKRKRSPGQSTSPTNNFSCKVCPKTFASQGSLDSHTGWHKRKPSPSGKSTKDPPKLAQRLTQAQKKAAEAEKPAEKEKQKMVKQLAEQRDLELKHAQAQVHQMELKAVRAEVDSKDQLLKMAKEMAQEAKEMAQERATSTKEATEFWVSNLCISRLLSSHLWASVTHLPAGITCRRLQNSRTGTRTALFPSSRKHNNPIWRLRPPAVLLMATAFCLRAFRTTNSIWTSCTRHWMSSPASQLRKLLSSASFRR